MATAARAGGTVRFTGSSGYIGSAPVKRLTKRFRVVGFDRDMRPPQRLYSARSNVG